MLDSFNLLKTYATVTDFADLLVPFFKYGGKGNPGEHGRYQSDDAGD